MLVCGMNMCSGYEIAYQQYERDSRCRFEYLHLNVSQGTKLYCQLVHHIFDRNRVYTKPHTLNIFLAYTSVSPVQSSWLVSLLKLSDFCSPRALRTRSS